jgi:hypothetical protein
MENVKYDQGAKKELREAAEWYNSQTPGKGEEFLQEVERAVVQLLRSPTRWRMVRPPYRRVLAKKLSQKAVFGR